MEPIITLDGFQLNPPTSDGTGFDAYGSDGLGLSGWYGAPARRATYTARPFGPGSYYGPAYTDARQIGITGRVIQTSRAGLLAVQEQLAGICMDPEALYELRVVDEMGTRIALVQRQSDVLLKPMSDIVSDYQIGLTAPDPRKFDPSGRSVSTRMAQPGAGGIQWNGPAGTTGAMWNGPAGGAGLVLGQPADTGSILVDNSAGTAPADMLLTITGPALNPVVSTPFGRIAYGGALGDGDVLVVNTGSGSVLLNGANRRNLLTSADLVQIPAEQQMAVRFTADLQNSVATLTVQWLVSYA